MKDADQIFNDDFGCQQQLEADEHFCAMMDDNEGQDWHFQSMATPPPPSPEPLLLEEEILHNEKGNIFEYQQEIARLTCIDFAELVIHYDYFLTEAFFVGLGERAVAQHILNARTELIANL